MKLSIGAFTYVVRRVWDLRLDGERCDGLCDSNRRVIWLDGDLIRERWAEVLRHEYQHAWEYHAGGQRDAEARAQFAALVDATFAATLDQAGGIDCIEEIPVEGLRAETTRAGAASQARYTMATIDRRTCGNGDCGAEVMAGSIETSEPIELAPGVYAVDRAMDCECCGTRTEWRERCTREGLPLGGVICARKSSPARRRL